jgi:protein-tyrosine phosphatase
MWLGHAGLLRGVRANVSADILVFVDLALEESPATLSRDRTYCRMPLIDGPGNPPWLLRAAVDLVAGLLRSNTPTLVCCGAGMSRSPCIAAAAIASVNGIAADEGLRAVLKGGPADISPGLWAEIRTIMA